MTEVPLSAPEGRPAIVRAATCPLALALTLTAAVLAALPFEGRLAPLAGMLVVAAVTGVTLEQIADFHPYRRFGLANGVTLLRAGATAVFAAVAIEPALLGAPFAAWGAFALAIGILALDGIDGWLARRQGLVSPFGARFDMEVDALLILVLSALALGLGKAGPWVLMIGFMRYVFVAAGRLWPWLARPLPPSNRRRLVCAVQVAVLALILAPPMTAPLSAALAAVALVALAASFAADVAWLVAAR